MPSTLEGVAALLGGAQPARQQAAKQASRDQFGTVSVDELGNKTVLIDGSAEYAPCTATVEVHHGDRVMCHIVNHRIVVFANITVPSVNDGDYQYVKSVAEEADELLDGVAQVAATADKTLAQIVSDAVESANLLDGVEEVAEQSQKTLAQIIVDAEAAGENASIARAQAGVAIERAQAANAAAIGAGMALSEVENVVGTLNWIAEHGTFVAATEAAPVANRIYYEHSGSGTAPSDYEIVEQVPYTYELTTDSAIDATKTYYARTGAGTEADPYVYTAVESPVAEDLPTYYERSQSPAAAGLYYLVVDESVQNYIAAHVALMSDGLHVMADPRYHATQDASVNPSKTYYERAQSASGAWVYSAVANPTAEGLAGYFEKDAGYSARVGNSSFDIINREGSVVASYGEQATVGDAASVHQVVESDATRFMDGEKTVAYVSQDKFYAVNAEVDDALYIGDYSIRNASDGKLVIGLRR